MKKSSKRWLAILLCLTMALSLLPAMALPAFAAGTEPGAAAGPRTADSARTYYVSTSGNGTNDGLTEGTPLPGLDAVPWNQLLPGDSVLLKKGDTFPGAIRMVGVHGTEDAPVTIGAYGTGSAAPVIEARGQGIWLRRDGSTDRWGAYASAGVLLYNCSYIKVTGLDIVNVMDTQAASFQDITGASDAKGVSDHSGEKLTYSAVAVAAADKGAAEGIVLENISAHGDSDGTAVVKETSSSVTETNVTMDNTAAPRTYTNASGTYYVSSKNGSDSNDGTSPDAPFYSLHKINELNLQPGAKVYLEYGSVFENQYLHVKGGGADVSPVIIDAYGKVSGSKPVINTNGNGVWYQNYRKNLDNANHMRHGFVSSSILLYDIPYVEISNIAMTNFGRYGETRALDENLAAAGSVDGGTVPGETGYNVNGKTIGSYSWGGKMSRTGVAGVAQDKGAVTHTVLRNLDIENIYGNIIHKHMNNGGIYFTVARPLNEADTGIARFDGVRIEGCYLKRVSRWGIAVAHTSYFNEVSTQAAISDTACSTYGATNVYIGHNYLEEVGGDPITLMHAFEPLTEYNVSCNGGREMSSVVGVACYMNNHHPYATGEAAGNRGDVSAGIWPWKCKSAVFEHNECYTMLYSHLGGNNDAQPWDADFGDSTVYQYNYSSGNTGGCIMFCGGQAYNTVFRYNISYKDGKPWAESNPQSGANRRGILDPSGSPNGQFTNNTFIMAEGTPVYHYTSGSHHTVRNNIFFNLGNEYAPEGGWNAASGLAFSKNIYVGFATTGTGSYTQKDTDYTTLTKSDLFADPTFAGAPEAPKTSSKNGVRMVNGVRDWTHDWTTDFAMFEIADGKESQVANKGAAHDYDGLAQDSNFGVPRVANETDFFGNELDEVHDIGAFDTQTADPAPTPGNDCELVSSLYELRGTNSTELQVPFDTNRPLKVSDFVKGLTVSDGASVKVYSNNTEVTNAETPVAAGMTVKIVAADATENPTVYTIRQKNTYNSYADWIGNHQGNAWFYQYWDGTRFVNHTTWDSQWSCWGGAAPAYQSVERNQACGNISAEGGSGFTFRAPAGGKVTVKYYNYQTASAPVENQVQKRQAASASNTLTPSIRVYVNGVEQTDKAVAVNKDATAVTTTEMTFTVDQGDTLSFMAYNAGPFTNNGGNNGIFFNPVITYNNEAYTPGADSVAPTVPGALAVSKVTQTTATVTWTASTDNRGVDHYEVSVNGGAAESVTALTKELTGLTAGTQYTVTVKAVDAAGNESDPATTTFTTKAAPVVDDEAPEAPTNGQVVGTPTAATATISWTASTSDDVVGYEITVGGDTTVVIRNITQVTLTGLTAATNYTANVVAVDAAGNKSTPALAIPFTTGSADNENPTAPGGLIAAGVTDQSAIVRWTASTDNVGVAGYEIKLGASGDVQDVGGALQYALTGLTSHTQYTVYVRAYDAASNYSDWAQVEFTTLGSSACEITSVLFEVRGDNNDELQVPYTGSNPMSLVKLAAGLTVSEGASVKVYQADGTTEVTTGNVAEGMKVKIVAQDGVTVNPKVYTIKQKNEYNHKTDFVASQQGNVWFHQGRDAASGELVSFTSFAGGATGWWTGANNACAEYNGAADDDRNVSNGVAAAQKYAGTGFVFRAPASGKVEVSFPEQPAFRYPDRASSNSFDTFIAVYVNGEEVQGTKVQVPASGSATIDNFELIVERGDTIEFMALNEGTFTSNHNANSADVLFNCAVTYLNEVVAPGPDSVTLNETEATLYTNDGTNHTLQLTATVLPAEAEPEITWTSGDENVVTVSANGLVTAVGNGHTYVRATASGSGKTATAECQVQVNTRVEDITIKHDGTDIGAEPIKLYTNDDDASLPHSITLTAETTPANVTHPVLNWTRPDGAAGRLTISRNSNGSVTLTATDNELNVGEVTVEVASAEHPEIKTTFMVHVIRSLKNDVTIGGTPKYGQTLLVNLNQLSMSVIGKNAMTYQWKRDGEDITGATAQEYPLTEADIGKIISVTATPGDGTFYEGARNAALTEAVAKADNTDVPSGLTAVNCTSGDDGQITDLDASKAYEYKLADAGEWTTVGANSTTIDNLATGNYQVRFAETETQAAGTNFTTVTILADGVTSYEITTTVTPSEGGVISIGASQAEADDEVTVSAAANPGYVLKENSLKVTDAGGNDVPIVEGKFTMPAANVTVSAEFEAVELQLTHDLTDIFCDQVGHDHKVEYGQALEIHLTAAEGYTMPSSITVYKADGTTPFTDYRYIHTVAEPDRAVIRFAAGAITENLTIRGQGTIKTYVVNYTLTNGLSAPEANAPREAAYRALYEGTLVPAAGYELPDTIIVTVGGSLIGAENFSYNKETGLVRIITGQINGNVVITANGVDSGVTVISVTSVSLDKNRASVEMGRTVQLTANIAPADATDQTVVWSSSDPAVATVDETGLVTGISAGSSVITVTTVDGRLTDTCTVTVIDPTVGPSDPADLTELEAAYNAAKDVTNDNYTDASWDAFESARSEAETILDAQGRGYNQAQVDEAASALTAAQNGLTKNSDAPVDKTALDTLYTEMAAKEQGSYTDASWNDFQTALAAAKTVLDKADATQDEVDAAKENLQSAYDALSTEIDVPVVPSTPDTPSTSTEVKENPDGSTTTTVTDKKTGTVTETTERPDGSKETVETKKDGTVTETKIDAEGAKAEKVTDPEKNVAIKVTNADGEVLAEVKLPAEVTVPETRFEDVPEGHWADEAIHEMASLEIVNGVGNNEYNMNGSMKRGDLALLLSRLSNAGTDYDVKFTDVPADKYYAGGVAWAAKTGIVNGRSEELFKPEDTITRGELAVMLYRYAKLLKLDTSASTSELDVFTDGKDTAEWAADGVAWCVKNGIMQGKGGSILDSKSNVTRAEVAVMLQRFINLAK